MITTSEKVIANTIAEFRQLAAAGHPEIWMPAGEYDMEGGVLDLPATLRFLGCVDQVHGAAGRAINCDPS